MWKRTFDVEELDFGRSAGDKLLSVTFHNKVVSVSLDFLIVIDCINKSLEAT